MKRGTMPAKQTNNHLRHIIRASTAIALCLQMHIATAQTVQFNVPAQALPQALSQFARQAGLQLAFSPDLVQGKSAAALTGSHDAQSALQQLLQGTGLAGQIDGNTITIIKADATVLQEVKVTSGDQYVHLLPAPYAGGQVAQGVRLGVLGNTSNMKAPFSTTSYTAEAVKDQQANTIAEAINRDPSVRYTVLPGGNVDNLYIRGFPIWEANSGEIAFDGIYGIAPNYRVRTEYIDRIEVVKGPGALLFGMSPNGSVGGVINVAPKRANKDITSVTAAYTSDSVVRGHVDIGKRFGKDAEFGIRVNGSYYTGNTTMDHQKMDGDVLAVALDYEIDRFRATLDILSQNENIDGVGRPIMPTNLTSMPAAPSGRNNVTQPWEWSQNKERAVLLRTEFDVNDNLTVFANIGKSTADVSRVYDSAPKVISTSGDTSITPTYAIFDVDRSTVDAGLRSRFNTGSIKHSVTLQTAIYSENFNRALNPGAVVSSNIYNPVSYPEQSIARPSTVPKIYENRNTSVALVDTITMLEDKLQISAGVRRQKIKSTNFNLLSGAPSNIYDETITTPALGIVVRPAEHWSVYANYIEGLSKGDIAPPSASNYGEVLSPYKSKQYEIGTKYDFGRFMATIALFQIEKPSAGLDNGVYKASGEQINRGIELYGYGQVTDTLRLLGGITVLDAKINKSHDPSLVGNRPIGASRLLANLGAEWEVPATGGLTLSGDLTYTGRQYVNQANSLVIPSWTGVNVGARYSTAILGKKTTFRGAIQNLTNRQAWAGVTSWGAVSPMTPRTFVVSATVDF
jgi:iron complex outermembrane receptor protein